MKGKIGIVCMKCAVKLRMVGARFVIGTRGWDMGEAMPGDAIQEVSNIKWYSIRKTSHAQIPTAPKKLESARQQAGEISTK